ncbi:maltooligosyl trehalose synthase [Nocardioides scoriae]|uniref:Maltooligosyl trehalose synthase n=1 Tax=Nocardioides scoriae TaxID=642780 RepID=A0A1H1W5T7_9ACTN|nr:malto-oligosyltrehalose synthase [Nocardioides scoriae]SDS91836.1 maltooligosyl trehalose synthase [Nocardioides scoriae]
MRTPASTYRVQVTADTDLPAVARLLPYLHDLGVDWVYLSPLLQAEPGSDHGYDVVDPTRVDASRGGPEGLALVAEEAHRLGMGVLVDVVPNHVGVATPVENPWWWDLLQHGQESAYAASFDVDWDFGLGRLRIPVLGDDDLPTDGGPIGHLEVRDGELRYHDNRFPLAPGTAADGDDVMAVHERQHYELVSWRRADSELNYRRFFTVTTLAGVRVELPEVFRTAHLEVRRWFDEGLVDGLRVDHPDGLRDPGAYLDDLAQLTGGAYVLVEKILEPGEELPTSWATAGTTGYDVLGLLDRVLTDPAGRAPLDALEARLRGTGPDGAEVFAELVHASKRDVATGSLLAETRRIVRELPDLLPATPEQLEDAVAELLACFGVYRSYLPLGSEHLDHALEEAHRRRPDLAGVLGELAPVLRDPEGDAARRFQQTSGMVMAKGVEDSSFYRFSRLTSHNEVGGDPATWSVTPEQWHEAMAVRQAAWPHAMTTLTTHDTKRGEDTRARITALAEVPERWEQTLTQLLAIAPVPDEGFGQLLWQAVVGAWPARVDGELPSDLRERLSAYAEKAMREAGDRTTWTDPDEDYERAVHRAVDAALDDPEAHRLVTSLVADLADAGWSNALAAKAVAITAPGVCDVYQGSELWEQSLVDPDNRRPVDFERRAALLASLDGATAAPSAPSGPDDEGVAKLWVTATALRLRRDRPELFDSYLPLAATGEAAEHALAFGRGGALTVATRLPLGLAASGGWRGTTLTLPIGTWRDALDPAGPTYDGQVALGDLLHALPVAVLVKED